ncbi:hypothetical protein [Acinetobacter haemolyticus]|uniref:hypothetical protein n=2 Tax=Acinetobacter haemolyticus TaxID=29430 RepID=UPI00094927BF|nr:hypothetical protein [Acinetobacter haemolyticus]APR70674.1 hypothetical protein AHTJS_09990 [Acinetobacter haemolyticus]MCU4386644.1 hypothetical protein [Acinetobacter haemolyticus]NCU24790.1 hypothetical protein [Acinetobacter haemolyticus]
MLELKKFFMHRSVFKKYISICLGSLMFSLLVIVYLKGKLELDFAISIPIAYYGIYIVLGNHPLPLFPEIHDNSNETEVAARGLLLGFFVIAVLGLMLVQLMRA